MVSFDGWALDRSMNDAYAVFTKCAKKIAELQKRRSAIAAQADEFSRRVDTAVAKWAGVPRDDIPFDEYRELRRSLRYEGIYRDQARAYEDIVDQCEAHRGKAVAKYLKAELDKETGAVNVVFRSEDSLGEVFEREVGASVSRIDAEFEKRRLSEPVTVRGYVGRATLDSLDMELSKRMKLRTEATVGAAVVGAVEAEPVRRVPADL